MERKRGEAEARMIGVEEVRKGRFLAREEEERVKEGRRSWRCRFWKSRPEAAGSR